MSNIFFVSDLHLQHQKLLSYGRGQFKTIEEHDQTIIDNINAVVKKDDTLWMLGDLSVGGDLTEATKARFKSIICQRINVVLGNHDTPEKIKFYATIFQKIVGAFEFKGDLILTHIPVHTCQFDRFKVNIHGHLHDNIVTKGSAQFGAPFDDADHRYVIFSMEQIAMKPVAFDTIKANLRSNGVI